MQISARMKFIDALRGIASIWVATIHIYQYKGYASTLLDAYLPGFIVQIINRGGSGVPIFFVISGFVIAYTLHNFKLTLRSAGRYMFRRILRLEPTLWVAMIIMVILWHLKVSPIQVFLNVFYIVGFKSDWRHHQYILSVQWTLAIEIQFYIVMLLFMRVSQNKSILRLAVFGITTLLSIGMLAQWIPLVNEGLFIYLWWQFMLGVLVFWILNDNISIYWLGCISILIVMTFLCDGIGIRDQMITVVTAWTILIVGKKNMLYTALNWKPLQFLGMISYSLYLVHPSVGCAFMQVFGSNIHRPDQMLGIYLSALVISIIAAVVMFFLVERPTTILSKKINLSPE